MTGNLFSEEFITMAKKPLVSAEDARREALKTALSTIERKYGQALS